VRYFIASLVVIMLFVLPAGSWWYLNKGFNYRKQILEEIEVKSSLLENQSFDGQSKQKLDSLLNDRISVLVTHKELNKQEQETLLKIKEKYGGRDLFQVVKMIELSDFKDNWSNDKIYLVDQELNIRNEYSFEKQDIKKLVEHIAALIPMPVREEVKLKRELIDD